MHLKQDQDTLISLKVLKITLFWKCPLLFLSHCLERAVLTKVEEVYWIFAKWPSMTARSTRWKCFLLIHLTSIWYFKRKISFYCYWPGWRPADCVHRQESSGVQRGPEPAGGARQGRRPHQGQGRARPRPRRLAVRRGSERNFRMLPFTSAK